MPTLARRPGARNRGAIRSSLAAPGKALQRAPAQIDDPARAETVHQNLFVAAPAGGTRKPWVSGTETVIKKEFKDHVLKQVEGQPTKILGTVTPQTKEKDADADAIAADAQIHKHFPMITKTLTQTEIKKTVTVFPPDFAIGKGPDPKIHEHWIANQLGNRTQIRQWALKPSDQAYKQIVQDLAADSGKFPIAGIKKGIEATLKKQGVPKADIPGYLAAYTRILKGKTWAWLFNRLTSRSGGFHGSGKVFISEGRDPVGRRLTILHELMHHYAHPDYRRWLAKTTDERWFNEGFTEILARQLMTSAEVKMRKKRGGYQKRVADLETKALPYVSMDDVARAFFLGEVWRFEATSLVAKEQFKTQVGLDPDAARADEVKQSGKSSKGIVQVVEPGKRYRFMNLEVGGYAPKDEHKAFFKDEILGKIVAKNPDLELRFVGHTSSTGSAALNKKLGLARAKAFTAMARKLGGKGLKLPDEKKPAHKSFNDPTASNDNVHGRALNRRVELTLTKKVPP